MSVIFKRSNGIFHLPNSRTFLNFKWGKTKHDSCKRKTCGKKFRPLFFEMFGEGADVPPELKKLCALKKEGREQEFYPKVDDIPGIKYKTCGSAILLQEDTKLPEVDEPYLDKEIKRLQRIEAHPTLKGEVDKPFPHFTSVEQRMIDLCDRRLHPLHLKMQTIPKRKVIINEQSKPYTSSDMLVTPKQIHIDRNLLEKKNILVDLKRIEPPKEVIHQGLEQKLKHLAQLKNSEKKARSAPSKPTK